MNDGPNRQIQIFIDNIGSLTHEIDGGVLHVSIVSMYSAHLLIIVENDKIT